MVCLFVLQAVGSMQSRLYEALGLAVVGMLVVFVALSVTAVTIVLLNRLIGSVAPRQADRAGHGGVEDATLKIVIAAAAATALGREVSITRIQSGKS